MAIVSSNNILDGVDERIRCPSTYAGNVARAKAQKLKIQQEKKNSYHSAIVEVQGEQRDHNPFMMFSHELNRSKHCLPNASLSHEYNFIENILICRPFMPGHKPNMANHKIRYTVTITYKDSSHFV